MLDQSNSKFNQLSSWLTANLNDVYQVDAICTEINKVPLYKGIYFWFMHPDAYRELSLFVQLNHIIPNIQRNFNGVVYHLVYIGTAGARENQNGENRANLRSRLKWHLCDLKAAAHVCNGTMSTFRRTIGGLMFDDLISNGAQDGIDAFFGKYFKISYIPYHGEQDKIIAEINDDEVILIKGLTPLFNIRNNPSASDKTQMTNKIKARRRVVEKRTKELYCSKDSSRKEKKGNASNPNGIISSHVDSNSDDNISFRVKINELIHEVASRIQNLPIGPCSFIIRDFENPSNFLYCQNNGIAERKIRTPGRKISEYFQAPDTAFKDGKTSKSKVVQREMEIKKINEIVIKFCK
jgi:hypothetical protein